MRPLEREQYRLTRAHVIALVSIVGATLGILRSFGRPWWCACGSWIPWSTDINGSHNSQHFVDPYSVSHFEHGLLFFVLLLPLRDRLSLTWRLVCAATLECGWELIENSSFIIDRYRAATISLDYYGDSVLNSLSDVVFASLGFIVASQLPTSARGRVPLPYVPSTGTAVRGTRPRALLQLPKLRFWIWWALLVIFCELVLIFTIRDSLAINVIMLVHPVDAIRAWQSAG